LLNYVENIELIRETPAVIIIGNNILIKFSLVKSSEKFILCDIELQISYSLV